MENKWQEGSSYSYSSSSSSSSSINQLFGPKDSSSSSTSAVLGSIFPPPSTGLACESGKTGPLRKQGESNKSDIKDIKNSIYKNETTEPCYLSSSIYYGGQENYSPRTKSTDSHHVVKKDGGEGDPNGSNANNAASRGNWWQGSLYY
ncbi:hypothetical protein Ddye_032268 [Dipteronia dyeriana]|uniref:Uncharacterized protein n=1 Tax=Dipteronia dyeriana TaxID=168575 RepID=A0AAD9TKJ1_9ROSI|nr:hypothetical protein Ddye_032268 [Dipteronia dyeriana]